MSTQNIVRAWKDSGYRASLSEAEQASLPAHPAGAIELSNAELGVTGKGVAVVTWKTCNDYCGGKTTGGPVC